jgi:broad specificity phosphatase PhoE
MIFAIRHGERADHAGKQEQDKIEIPIDPHLTDLGKV